MAVSVQQTWVSWVVTGLGDIADIDPTVANGIIDSIPVAGITSAICGLRIRIQVTAEDTCFFGDENPCTPPVWALSSGTLPTGVTLDPSTGLTVSSTVILALGNGPGAFTVSLTDSCGDVTYLTYYPVTQVLPPPPTPPDEVLCPSWEVGPLWTVSPLCAHNSTNGLRRVADGITGTSETVSLNPVTVIPGQIYFLEFLLRGSGGANGVVSMGLKFYDSAGAFLSESLVSSTGSPTDWTAFFGNVTVPVDAATAVVFFRATGHLVGTWCVANPFAARADQWFSLSSLRHYYDEYANARP